MIEFTSRVDRIAAEIRRQILQGKMRPGEKLPSERSLCTVYGVGRTTVREALKSLAVSGLVTRQGRAVLIADPENVFAPSTVLAELAVRVSIRQLYEVRKLLEVRVAGWAALRATKEDIEAIKSAIDNELSKNAAAGNPNRVFHDAMARAAHNPALEQIYESGRQLFFRLPFYWKLFDDSEVKTLRTRRHELARRWHEQILKAIEQHDAAEAEGAMFQHLDIMEKDLLTRLQGVDGESKNQTIYSHPLLVDLDPEKKTILEGSR